MEQAISASQTLHLGSDVIKLLFVEVIPLITTQGTGIQSTPRPALSSPRVKLLLRRKTQCSLVSRHGSAHMLKNMDKSDDEVKSVVSGSPPLMSGSLSFPVDNESGLRWACIAKSRRIVPVVFLPSENPTELDPIPCWIVGYGTKSELLAENAIEVIITASTLVRVSPPETAAIRSDPKDFAALSVEPQPIQPLQLDWKCTMTGESCQPPLSTGLVDEVFHSHDAETVRALSLRMSMLLAQPIAIGTTADALASRRTHRSRWRAISSALDSSFRSKHSTGDDADPVLARVDDGNENNIPIPLQEGALIVHSPNHGAGKTLLVRAIAQERLKCQAIHVIQPTSLLAQYGIHADAALESILHAIVIRVACKQQSVCIILDHLDAMVPPLYSSRAGAGDAAMPVLKAIASYLKSLTLALKRNHEFLFPTKSPLYNLGGSSGGNVLNANICLVGIITCDDDGGRSKGDAVSKNLSTGLDAMVAGRYRLPALSAAGRVAAFQYAFDRLNIKLDDEALARFPILAASAIESRGQVFINVSRRLANLSKGKPSASLNNLKAAFRILRQEVASMSNVEFAENETKSGDGDDLFASVGGNMEAKRAIEEALALDPDKRRILRAFSLQPPTGILLYGPPGTGKTLLAKSVAKLLKSQTDSSSSFGGSFVSLQASEIVRGEVGNSEKVIASAFETARSNAPAVVFIDEFQALFTERSGSGSGKLTSTLLQCMDDVCRWRDGESELNPDPDASTHAAKVNESRRVVVIAATNTPWMVDKAFLRPGRFDRVIHVGLPLLNERVSILRVHISCMRLSSSSDSPNVERICQTLAEMCNGFSGADLAALCRAAAVKCLSEGGADARVELRHFQEAREGFVPSCDVKLVTKLSTWRP